MPTLAFQRQLVMQCMENTIGTYSGDIVRHMKAYIRPQIVEYRMEKVPNYSGKWLSSEKISKFPSRNIRISSARTIQNREIKLGLISYATEECFYDLGASQIIRYMQ